MLVFRSDLFRWQGRKNGGWLGMVLSWCRPILGFCLCEITPSSPQTAPPILPVGDGVMSFWKTVLSSVTPPFVHHKLDLRSTPEFSWTNQFLSVLCRTSWVEESKQSLRVARPLITCKLRRIGMVVLGLTGRAHETNTADLWGESEEGCKEIEDDIEAWNFSPLKSSPWRGPETFQTLLPWDPWNCSWYPSYYILHPPLA